MRMRQKIEEDFKKTGNRMRIAATFFDDYTAPSGFLNKHPACHALFYYHALARQNYENIVEDPLFLEGHLDPEANFSQLFASVAIMYNVEPETMIQFWPDVNMQCRALQMPMIPDEYRYRHNKVIEYKT